MFEPATPELVSPEPGMLEHGGQLHTAAARYNIPLDQWLDLSTGINPLGYPPPELPPEAWSRLPQEADGLEEAARAYYGTADVLPVAGSQAAILALPRLRRRCRVGVLHPGYGEHAWAWRSAGHEVIPLAADEIAQGVNEVSVLVLANPNNPTGITFAREALLGWHQSLAARGGWLVLDEAFVEATQETSLAQQEMPEGLIVLRSLGKFFGLAGARVGFVLAQRSLRARLRAALGPWTLPGPSREAAQAALRDHAWQIAARGRLLRDGERLAQLLHGFGLTPQGGSGLFQWVVTESAQELHEQLARRGILTRYFADPNSLRFGLPGPEADWEKLRAALEQERG